MDEPDHRQDKWAYKVHGVRFSDDETIVALVGYANAERDHLLMRQRPERFRDKSWVANAVRKEALDLAGERHTQDEIDELYAFQGGGCNYCNIAAGRLEAFIRRRRAGSFSLTPRDLSSVQPRGAPRSGMIATSRPPDRRGERSEEGNPT